LSVRKPSSLLRISGALRPVGEREGAETQAHLLGVGGQIERGELPGRIRRAPWHAGCALAKKPKSKRAPLSPIKCAKGSKRKFTADRNFTLLR
jgi:hypothetical protein